MSPSVNKRNMQANTIDKNALRLIRQYTSENIERRNRFKSLRDNVFPIKPSQYDMSAICNLRCEGCLYYSGSYFEEDVKHRVKDEALHEFYRSEKERGVNFPHFGGAEPALRQNVLHVAGEYFDRGVVYTNGSIKISDDINFMRHISVWGDSEDTKLLRGLDIFDKSLANYKYDERAIFVITITKKMIRQLPELVKTLFDNGVKVTFNLYSPTSEFLRVRKEGSSAVAESKVTLISTDEELFLDEDSLSETRAVISRLIDDYPGTVIFSEAFNKWVTQSGGIYSLDPDTGWANNCASRLDNIMRHYLPDLSREESTKCCSPNIECSTCRLYSMSFASAINNLSDFLSSGEKFDEWLEITQTWSKLFLRSEAS